MENIGYFHRFSNFVSLLFFGPPRPFYYPAEDLLLLDRNTCRTSWIATHAFSLLAMISMMVSLVGLLVLLAAVVTSNTNRHQAEAFRALFARIRRTATTKGGGSKGSGSGGQSSSASVDPAISIPFLGGPNNSSGSSGGTNNQNNPFEAWWEDLAPPFKFQSEDDDLSAADDDLGDAAAINVQVDDEYLSNENANGRGENAGITHFCFLVHGHRGYSRDLSYLQTVMQRLARKEKKRKVWLQRQQQQQQELAAAISSSSSSRSDEGEGGVGALSSGSEDSAETDKRHDEFRVPERVSSSESGEDAAADTEESSSGSNHSRNTILPREANTRSSSSSRRETKVLRQDDIVVHAAECNERKTTDGVMAGGERLLDEMISVIRREMSKRHDATKTGQQHQRQQQQQHDEDGLKDITFSVLGNSLGGLYSRYAIAKLAERCQYRKDPTTGQLYYVLDGKYRVHLNVFCTTATPHLGIAGHTFIPIPRSAEIGIAHSMGHTGKDLFRLNDLMKTMATSPEFLGPLAAFRKRIAYANAYGTDFPVPMHTAAFLNEESDYPHHFFENSEEEDRLVVDDNGLVIATLHTPPQCMNRGDENKEDGDASASSCYVDQQDTDELAHMSTSLDALGWKKVFVDVRKEIPRIPIPAVVPRILNANNESKTATTTSSPQKGFSSSDTGGVGTSLTSTASQWFTLLTNNENKERHEQEQQQRQQKEEQQQQQQQEQRVEPIHLLKQKGGAVGSRDVAAALSAPLFEETFHWPLGHNMIVAFSRSRWSTYMNKAGRPVVDALAKELVQDIFAWQQQQVPQQQQQQRQQAEQKENVVPSSSSSSRSPLPPPPHPLAEKAAAKEGGGSGSRSSMEQ